MWPVRSGMGAELQVLESCCFLRAESWVASPELGVATSPSRGDTHVTPSSSSQPWGDAGASWFPLHARLKVESGPGGVGGDLSVLSDAWHTASARRGPGGEQRWVL